MHISGIEQEKSELSLVSELSFFHFQMFIQNKGNQFHCCWWSLTAHLHEQEREKWSGGRQLHFPYFPKPGFPCAQIFYSYFWQSSIAWWQEKKYSISSVSQTMGTYQVSCRFQKEFSGCQNKCLISLCPGRRTCWVLPQGLGGSCTVLGPMLTIWIHQQNSGER